MCQKGRTCYHNSSQEPSNRDRRNCSKTSRPAQKATKRRPAVKAIPAVTKQEVKKSTDWWQKWHFEKHINPCRNTMTMPYVSMQEIWRE